MGGDLAPERLLLAYRHGIFPWFSDGDPILWWSPDPRFVLFPDRLLIPRSLRQILRHGLFTVTFDACFAEVVSACQEDRQGREGTWITDGMKTAYVRLHEMGLAHSVETWREDRLVGGLYGVSLGRIFFGESMFSRVADASKTALATLVRCLAARKFLLIDCQVYTEHLDRLGAELIPRDEFLRLLGRALDQETLQGSWRFFGEGDSFAYPHGVGAAAAPGLEPQGRCADRSRGSPGMTAVLAASRRRAASPYFTSVNG